MGGFKGGLSFNNTVGGVCKSMCIAIVIVRVVGLHPMLDLTSPFFNSTSGPIFDLLCPLTDLLFGLLPHCGCFINDWCGSRFSGYGGHWDVDEWWGVRDGHRNFVG